MESQIFLKKKDFVEESVSSDFERSLENPAHFFFFFIFFGIDFLAIQTNLNCEIESLVYLSIYIRF